MDENLKICIAMAGIAGIVGGIVMVAHDDHANLQFYKKMRCKFGLHKMFVRIGFLKINKYYCQYCKKQRKHPDLKIIDGGNKLGNNRFKF